MSGRGLRTIAFDSATRMEGELLALIAASGAVLRANFASCAHPVQWSRYEATIPSQHARLFRKALKNRVFIDDIRTVTPN